MRYGLAEQWQPSTRKWDSAEEREECLDTRDKPDEGRSTHAVTIEQPQTVIQFLM